MRAAAAVAISGLWLIGCGSADQTRAARDDEPTDQILQVNQDFNLCPHFEGSLISPQTIPPGQSAAVIVRAIDPDGDDAALTYTWTVTAGSLSTSEGAALQYTCTDLGPQILTVVTKDALGCHVSLDIGVICLEH